MCRSSFWNVNFLLIDLWKHVPNFPDFINAVILCTQWCLSFIPCSAHKLNLLFNITLLMDFMKTWPTDVNIVEYSGTALKKIFCTPKSSCGVARVSSPCLQRLWSLIVCWLLVNLIENRCNRDRCNRSIFSNHRHDGTYPFWCPSHCKHGRLLLLWLLCRRLR